MVAATMETIMRASASTHPLPTPATSGRWRDLFAGTLQLIVLWHERARQRRALATLDERMLRDIGITRYDALLESAKPFWEQ
jgi:uncharacterized protein YjiS (DUF1127 family)